MATRKTLTREDWTAAGLAALVEGGPDAVAVEPVAARLGTTKGSGYWHFADRADLLRAVLDAWVAQHTIGVRDRVEAGGGTPRERLRHLLGIVSRAAEQSPADLLLVASADPVVRAAVVEATQLRVAYVERLIREDGVPGPEARSRAVLAYAAYLGHASLTSAVPGLVPHEPADRRRMQESLLAMALPDVTP
ncbi:MAG TPA: TetR/AcrR family transcriptional regulator [Lapillicoccus sp.]|nr:TetR/AcrR family transcriptional regulator [Lapillicoccus sp.]